MARQTGRLRAVSCSWISVATLFQQVGCSPAPEPRPPAEVPQSRIEPATTPEIPVALWRCFPTLRPSDIADGAELPDRSWLLVGEGGERWLTAPLPATLPPDQSPRAGPFAVRASAFRAPEPLRSVIPLTADRWAFAGASGTLYLAGSPLGPIVARARPQASLSHVTGSSRGVIGLTDSGRVLRWDQAGWSAPDQPVERLFDQAVTPGGQLLALAIPERLLASEDGGLHWTALGTAPIGAQRLVRAAQGGIIVEGITGSLYWSGSAPPRLVTDEQPLGLPSRTARLEAPKGPSALAVAEGRAAFTGRLYYEARENEEDGWLWLSGPADELTARTIEPLTGCESVRLGAAQQQVVLSCIQSAAPDDESTSARLFRSSDGGRSWRQEELRLATPEAEGVAVAVAPDGTALVTGACRWQDRLDCSPVAPLRLTPAEAGAASTARPAAAPELTGPPLGPVFSEDGRSAYFLGRRTKDGRYGLFLSKDAGRSFTSGSLAPPAGSGQSWDLDDNQQRALHPGPDGELGILVQSEPPVYVVTDARGTITSVAQLPAGVQSAAGHGRSIFALGTEAGSREGALRLTAWTSADGGLSFAKLGLPFQPLPYELTEAGPPREEALWQDVPLTTTVACGPFDCAVGSILLRRSWGSEASTDTPLPPPPADDPPAQPAVRTPIRCTVDDQHPWITVTDLYHRYYLPTAHDAMRGDSAWSVLRFRNDTGEAVAYGLDMRSQLNRYVLFGPAPRRSTVAIDISPQMEGYAMARVQLARPGPPQPGSPMKSFELSWINYTTRETGRVTLSSPGVFGAGDATPDELPVLLAGLLSVSPGGIFVRPHSEGRETFFLHRDGSQTGALLYPDWPTVADATIRGGGDAVFVPEAGGTYLGVGLMHRPEHPTTVALAVLDPIASSPMSFTTLAPSEVGGREVVMSWDYLDRRVGVTTHVNDDDNLTSWAYFNAFEPSGRFAPPRPLPTQRDLAASPLPCSATDRSSSPRLVAPFSAGTRHPVVVSLAGESHVLLTGSAVLHGSPQTPCLAAWDAAQLGTSQTALGALISGDLQHAWLFRPSPDLPQALDYRPMSCELAPGAPIPADVWRERGTTVRSSH